MEKPRPSPVQLKRSARKIIRKRAKLEIGRHQQVLPCEIEDMSATGARIIHSGEHVIPRLVTLDTGFFGKRRQAQVVWRGRFDAGLEFIKKP